MTTTRFYPRRFGLQSGRLALPMLGVFCAVVLGACNEEAGRGPEDINDLVSENEMFQLEEEKPLTKDREEQVGEEWTETETVQDAEGEREVTTRWSTVRKYYSALNHPDKFVLYNVNASVLWPGNLIQGNSIASGTLNPIPITGEKRKPVDVFISIVTGTGGEYSATVEEPTGSRVFEAMNGIVGQHYGSTPGQTSLEISRVYSMNHVMFNLNAGYSVPSSEISAALNLNWEDQRERVMVKFSQQYFSMAYDTPHDAESLFQNDVQAGDLAPFTDKNNPLCYVDSVTYGRLFLFIYESADTSFDLEANINVAFNGLSQANVEARAAYNEVVQNSSVKVYALGGNVQEALSVATDFGSLRDYLLNGAVLSEDSPGAPISYTMRYLKNASLVRMNNTLEYSVDQARPVAQPTSETTSTEFSLYLDRIQATDQYDGSTGGGSEGVVGFKVFKFEDGTKKEIFDTGLVCEFGQGDFDTGVTCMMDEVVEDQSIQNVAGNKIIIQAYGYEDDVEDDHWFWIDKEYVYTYGPSGNTWQLNSSDGRDSVDDLYFHASHSTDEYIEFFLKYGLTIDGVTLH